MTRAQQEPGAAYHVVVASFQGEDTSAAVLETLNAGESLVECEVEAYAVVSRPSARRLLRRAGVVAGHHTIWPPSTGRT